MSDIQRWDSVYDPTYGDHILKEHDAGRFVKHADHVEALRQAEQRIRDTFMDSTPELTAYRKAQYEQGQRDEHERMEAEYQRQIEQTFQTGVAVGQRDVLAAIQEAWDGHKRGNYHYAKRERCERCKGYKAARLAIKGDSDE